MTDQFEEFGIAVAERKSEIDRPVVVEQVNHSRRYIVRLRFSFQSIENLRQIQGISLEMTERSAAHAINAVVTMFTSLLLLLGAKVHGRPSCVSVVLPNGSEREVYGRCRCGTWLIEGEQRPAGTNPKKECGECS